MNDRYSKALDWVEKQEKIFAAVKSGDVMYAIITSIMGARKKLAELYPDLDARIDTAVRSCNARLTNKEVV